MAVRLLRGRRGCDKGVNFPRGSRQLFQSRYSLSVTARSGQLNVIITEISQSLGAAADSHIA